MSEIEEAIKRVKNECELYPLLGSYGDDELSFIRDIQTLLSSLEQAEKKIKELLTSFGSTLAFERIRELEVALEKEKERAEKLKIERDNWIDSANQYLRNQHFYQDLLDKVGKYLGSEVFVSDDGSIQDSPIRLKIPELVSKLKERAEKAERRVSELDGAIIGWKIVEKVLKEKVISLESALDITTGALEGSQGVVKELENDCELFKATINAELDLRLETESRIKELEEAVEEHKIEHEVCKLMMEDSSRWSIIFKADLELYKVLEKVKCKSPLNNFIKCPFCGENNFDLIGLKDHLLWHKCEIYRNTFNTLENRFKDRKVKDNSDSEEMPICIEEEP